MDDVVGDLEERARSRRFVALWYWRQTIVLLAYLMPDRLRAFSATRSRARVGDTLWHDVRYSWRKLLKRPGFSAVVILTLALGIGATTAIFTVMNAVVLRPLPFPESERLVALCETNEVIDGYCVASPPDAFNWTQRSRTLESIGVARNRPATLRDEDGGEGVQRGIATPEFLQTFGVVPLHGRLFDSRDQIVGRPGVVVLGHEIWLTRFGGDSDVLGRSVNMDGESYEIVGVLPSSVQIPMLKYIELWTPLPFDPRHEENRGWRGFLAVGRLADGVELGEAQSELLTIAGALGREFPETNDGWGVRVSPLKEHVVGPAGSLLALFLGAVCLVLLIGCVNVANLMLARAMERDREVAVATALGASGFRVVRQLLTESLLLSGLGGVAGLIMGSWAVRALLVLAPRDIPRLDEVSLDATVVVFALVLSVATALLFGAAPAVSASRVRASHALGKGPRAARSSFGLGGALVASEVALALVLSVSAGLLVRSFASVTKWEPGFERTRLLTLWVYTPLDSYPEGAQVVRFFERAAESIRTIPSVTAVGATSAGPLFGGRETTEFHIEGREATSDALPVARWYDVDAAYLPSLGVPLLQGRHFNASDHENAPRVAVVNETMARRYWAGEDPIGTRVTTARDGVSWEIVGIVSDVTPFLPGEAAEPEIYWPKLQYPRWATFFVVRTDAEPETVVTLVRERLEALDAGVHIRRMRTMDELVSGELVSPRFNMLLFLILAAVALTLAAVGTYGVLSYGVAQRTREIGLRISLGAERRDVVALIVGKGLKLTALGVVVGWLVAYLATRWLAHLLFGVESTDLVTYASMGAVLLLVASIACYVPARRASRLDPLAALRYE